MTKKNIYLALSIFAFLFAYLTSNSFSASGYVAGGWFLWCYWRKLEGERNWKAIQSALLRPCDEAYARTRLQRHPDSYVRVFGQPEIA